MDLSQDRLEGLLNERLNARGNKDKQDHIDQRIWDLFGEEWCILFTDFFLLTSRYASAFALALSGFYLKGNDEYGTFGLR